MYDNADLDLGDDFINLHCVPLCLGASMMTRFEKIIEGLKIIHSYDSEADVCANHDEIFVGSESSSKASMKTEDITTMEECGYTWDTKNDSWHRFV